MKPTQLIILGCGSSVGVPRIDGSWGKCNRNNKKNIRTRCSAIIKKGSNSILIDTSPDIRHQLLSNNIKDITSVVYTHEHADQTNGLFELRPFFWKKRKKINIYGNSRTINDLKSKNRYLFQKVNDYPPIVKPNIIKNSFSIGSSEEKVFFRTLIVKHGKIKSVVYIFENIAYISDSNDLTIVNNKYLYNLNYLILDCLKIDKHPSHFNLSEAIYIFNRLKPKKMILTNLNHDLDYDFLLRNLPKNVLPAYDGLTINLKR